MCKETLNGDGAVRCVHCGMEMPRDAGWQATATVLLPGQLQPVTGRICPLCTMGQGRGHVLVPLRDLAVNEPYDTDGENRRRYDQWIRKYPDMVVHISHTQGGDYLHCRESPFYCYICGVETENPPLLTATPNSTRDVVTCCDDCYYSDGVIPSSQVEGAHGRGVMRIDRRLTEWREYRYVMKDCICTSCNEVTTSPTQVGDEILCDDCSEVLHTCARCGDAFTSSADHGIVRLDDGTQADVCAYCRDNHTTECAYCHESILADDAVSVVINSVESDACDPCAGSYSTECDSCGERHDDSHMAEMYNGDYWCNNCREHRAFYCDGCGELMPMDRYSSDGYCVDCETPDEDHSRWPVVLGSYGDAFPGITKMNVHGESADDVHFGIEFEVNGIEPDDVADILHDIVPYKDVALFHVKNDASTVDGAEFVTQPMTLAYWQEYYRKWVSKAFSRMRDYGARICNNQCRDGAGMHIHVDRHAFTDDAIYGAMSVLSGVGGYKLAKIVSRRPFDKWNAYAPLAPTMVLGKCKDDDGSLSDQLGRYTAINSNRRTVEFRLFNGTLEAFDVDVALQFCSAMVDYTSTRVAEMCSAPGFVEFVRGTSKYGALVEVLRQY